MAAECTYCGNPNADTDDHIPAKNIYAQPTPANRPFVKSCRACNSGASDDDEFFRDVVLKYHRIVDLPQAQLEVAAMVRAAAKPKKAKYAKKVLDSFVHVVLANVVTPGDSNKEHRSYLKAVARETWDLVNALTHDTNATGFGAHAALQAVEHSLVSWSLALAKHGIGGPQRCPLCQSYQLHKDYESGEGFGAVEIVVCDKCGWRGDGVYVEPEEPKLPSGSPEGECVTVDVPLRPPFKRG